jgi:hypothetical protein
VRLDRKLPTIFRGRAVALSDDPLFHAAGVDGAPLCGSDVRPRRQIPVAMAYQEAVCPACWQRWMREQQGVDIRNAWKEPS